jgi:aspartate carbamoyltransferase catalytic subunit
MGFRHCIGIEDFSAEEILQICWTSLAKPPPVRALDANHPPVALVFKEPSTRTRVSFELAAHRLGWPLVFFQQKESSLSKGETLEDTVRNLHALGVGTFVIRTSETGGLEACRRLELGPVVNAGDGVGEHPTQALLDLATLLDSVGWDQGRLTKLKVGILGDIRRSRVAHSWAILSRKLGMKLVLISPPEWKPGWARDLEWVSEKAALRDLDVLMVLRVQKERMGEGPEEQAVTEAFVREYQVKPADLTPSQKLMHPGPVNWGVELSPEFLSDSRSLILKQVKTGLFVRATVLDWLRRESRA